MPRDYILSSPINITAKRHRHHGDVPREFLQSGTNHLALFRAPKLTAAVTRSTMTTLPMHPPRMSSSKLWRRGQTSPRSRQWYATIQCCPAAPAWPWPNNRPEEDPLHNVERRPPRWPPHAHNTIRHAQQVETAEEAHVPFPRGLPETRCAREAPSGVDSGVVRTYIWFNGATGSNDGKAMRSVSTYRHPTNTSGATPCASCRSSPVILLHHDLTSSLDASCAMLSW